MSGLTMRDMCEHIVKADFLKFSDSGQKPTAEEVFNYSPTGELYMIWDWYAAACAILGEPASPKGAQP